MASATRCGGGQSRAAGGDENRHAGREIADPQLVDDFAEQRLADVAVEDDHAQSRGDRGINGRHQRVAAGADRRRVVAQAAEFAGPVARHQQRRRRDDGGRFAGAADEVPERVSHFARTGERPLRIELHDRAQGREAERPIMARERRGQRRGQPAVGGEHRRVAAAAKFVGDLHGGGRVLFLGGIGERRRQIGRRHRGDDLLQRRVGVAVEQGRLFQAVEQHGAAIVRFGQAADLAQGPRQASRRESPQLRDGIGRRGEFLGLRIPRPPAAGGAFVDRGHRRRLDAGKPVAEQLLHFHGGRLGIAELGDRSSRGRYSRGVGRR